MRAVEETLASKTGTAGVMVLLVEAATGDTMEARVGATMEEEVGMIAIMVDRTKETEAMRTEDTRMDVTNASLATHALPLSSNRDHLKIMETTEATHHRPLQATAHTEVQAIPRLRHL